MKRNILYVLIAIYALFFIFGLVKPLPQGVSYESDVYNISSKDVTFLQDRTYVDEKGGRHSEQEIFDEVIRMVSDAHSYILVDMFLFNNNVAPGTMVHRSISQELVDALLSKKQLNPEMVIQVITDPVNEIYGSVPLDLFESLRDAGIEVITTDLRKLRDSHPFYSGFWRGYVQWFGKGENGFFPNPFEGGEGVTFRSYLSLLNYKANHRKLIVADYIDTHDELKMSALVTSANPHDDSSAHGNVALKIDSFVWKDALVSESAVIDFSGGEFVPYAHGDSVSETTGDDVEVQFVTEEKILDHILKHLRALREGDSLDLAMFYIAERDIVNEIEKADQRGVLIRLLLDPSKDAFGRQKNGMPNRQVAHELMSDQAGNIQIRWCDTHGEQCHSKLMISRNKNETTLFVGSANFTRRNLKDFNLETNIVLTGSQDVLAIRDAEIFFEERWGNIDGKIYSTDYETYKDSSLFKTIRYRLKEFSGISRW